MPLSILNESVGRPYMFHWRITTGSPKIAVIWKSREHTMLYFVTAFTHFSIWACLNCMVNGPRYATTPALIRMSPTDQDIKFLVTIKPKKNRKENWKVKFLQEAAFSKFLAWADKIYTLTCKHVIFFTQSFCCGWPSITFTTQSTNQFLCSL